MISEALIICKIAGTLLSGTLFYAACGYKIYKCGKAAYIWSGKKQMLIEVRNTSENLEKTDNPDIVSEEHNILLEINKNKFEINVDEEEPEILVIKYISKTSYDELKDVVDDKIKNECIEGAITVYIVVKSILVLKKTVIYLASLWML